MPGDVPHEIPPDELAILLIALAVLLMVAVTLIVVALDMRRVVIQMRDEMLREFQRDRDMVSARVEDMRRRRMDMNGDRPALNPLPPTKGNA